MTLLEQSPHILARLYLWHKPFNELVAYRSINHNTCQAADLVLFSRDGAESIRLQEIFLEQWAALTPEVLRTRINTSLISYLRRHIHYKTVSLRYRFLGMIVLAAFHNIHLEIDDELFKQLSSRLFAGIFQQQTLKPLHMVFNYLSSNQIKSISVSIRDILENEKHYDYDTALFHLTALAPKLPQDSLLSFLPFLVDGLATSSERTRTFVIECLKAFVSKLTTKHQLALCSRLLSNLQGSMISPSSIYQCLGSFESLLSPSVRRVIIPQILQEMRTHQTANRQHLIQCNVMFTSSFTKAEQDQLFMVLLANLKCGDENRRIHTLQEIDSLKHLSSPFVSRVIPFITNKLMDNSVLCRQLAQTLLVRLAPGLKKKILNRQAVRLGNILNSNQSSILDAIHCAGQLAPLLEDEEMNDICSKLICKLSPENQLCRPALKVLASLLPRLHDQNNDMLMQKLFQMLHSNAYPIILDGLKLCAYKFSTHIAPEVKQRLLELWHSDDFYARRCRPQILDCLGACHSVLSRDEIISLTREAIEMTEDERQLHVVVSIINFLTILKDKMDTDTLNRVINQWAGSLSHRWSTNAEELEYVFPIRQSILQFISNAAPLLTVPQANRLGEILLRESHTHSSQETASVFFALAQQLSSPDSLKLLLGLMNTAHELNAYTGLKSPLCLKLIYPLLRQEEADNVMRIIIAKTESKNPCERFQAANYFNHLLTILSPQQIERLLPFIYKGLTDEKPYTYLQSLKTLEWIQLNTAINLEVVLTAGFNNMLLHKPGRDSKLAATMEPACNLLVNNIPGQIDTSEELSSTGIFMKCFIETLEKTRHLLTPACKMDETGSQMSP